MISPDSQPHQSSTISPKQETLNLQSRCELMLDPMVQNAGLQVEEVNGQKLKSNQTQVCVLADLMQDPMIKKAGLRKEEVLALMLYTGLCPAPPRPPPQKSDSSCAPRTQEASVSEFLRVVEPGLSARFCCRPAAQPARFWGLASRRPLGCPCSGQTDRVRITQIGRGMHQSRLVCTEKRRPIWYHVQE